MSEIDAQMTGDTVSSPPRKRRWVVRAVAVVLVLLVAGELFARFVLGLGDPPLSVSHPTIEYMLKPSQTCRRFGNTVSYNAYSMRSPDFPKRKTDSRELRVMVLGDSVINGGALTDQQDTVTAQLQRSLERELGRPVVVGNISAGSWGPPNLLAYVEAFGWFDADVVVVVLSSHDYADAPTFVPVVGVDRAFPAEKPYLALQEGVARYLMPRLLAQPGGADAPPPAIDAEAVTTSTAALRRLLEDARESGAEVVFVAQYPERRELRGPYTEGHAVIGEIAVAAGVPVIDLRPVLVATGAEEQLYIDDIHPSALARTAIAHALNRGVRTELAGRAGRQTTKPSTKSTTTKPTTTRRPGAGDAHDDDN